MIFVAYHSITHTSFNLVTRASITNAWCRERHGSMQFPGKLGYCGLALQQALPVALKPLSNFDNLAGVVSCQRS